MFLEILLGAGLSYFLRQLYYDHVFTSYPVVRYTGVSVLLPFVGALALAWAVDGLYRVFQMPFRGWAKGPFWNRGLGLSLFAGALLQIEAGNVAREYRLSLDVAAGIVGVLSFLLAWLRVRHLHYKGLLATMPDDSPSALYTEAIEAVAQGNAAPSPKKRKKRLSASASAQRTKRPRHEPIASLDDEVWAAFEKEIRSRSHAQMLAQRNTAHAPS